MSPGSAEQMQAEIRKWAGGPVGHAPAVRVVNDTSGEVFRTQQLALQVEPALEIAATLYAPNAPGRKPAVLLVDQPAAAAERLAARNFVVLNLEPRGMPLVRSPKGLSGAEQNTRAWVIGKNLAGMRAGDIMRGVDLLVDRPDVEGGQVRAAARGVDGVWLLMAAAQDPRLTKIWLDQTPHSLRTALDVPITRDLFDVVIPGFALHWDLNDLVKVVAPRSVLWTDPTDWMGVVTPHLEGFRYRSSGEATDRFWSELTK
jgi:hypothetical protein